MGQAVGLEPLFFFLAAFLFEGYYCHFGSCVSHGTHFPSFLTKKPNGGG